MAVQDDLAMGVKKYDDFVAKARAAAPGLDSYQSLAPAAATPASASPAPASSSPRLRRSLGTQFGQGLRRGAQMGTAAGLAGANAVSRAGEDALNLAASPARAVANFGRDTAAAVRGAPAPAPLGRIALPRLRLPGAASPAAAGAPEASAGGTPTQPYQRTSPASRYVPARPGAAGREALSTAAAAAPTPAPAAGFNLQPGDVNTFTGGDGVTRPVPGMLRRPGAADAPQASAPAPAAPARVEAPAPSLGAVRGRQGAIIANPTDSVESRLTRAMGSASLRGSPSARQAVAKAILDEVQGQREERQSALATGDQADLAQLQANAQAQESFLQRQQRAGEFNVATQEARAAREFEAANRAPTITSTEDGSMGIVSPTGSWTPVTDAGGARLRAPTSIRQTGELSQGDLLKSYTDRYNAIAGGLGNPEEKQSQLDALNSDPLYAQLPGRGGTTAARPTLDQFLAAARAANPGTSDADLTAYYQQTYGR